LKIKYLLDASALLAVLREEPGADVVTDLLPECAINAVNLVEVLTKAIKKGVAPDDAREYVGRLDIPVLPVTQAEADASVNLAPLAWQKGISLGDRLCLATCITHNLIALTTESRWPDDAGVSIQRIR
jgi:PIN domain nuclease of toxin-antitoxin system